MSFTNLEYSDIIFLYGFCNGNESAARREYQARYPQRRIPHRRVFGRTFSRLRAVGSFHASSFVERTLRPAHVANEERVVRLVTNDPSLSTRRIAAIVGMSQTRVWRILRRDGLHPFHLTPVQKVVAADYQKRMDFYAWLIENSDRDRLFLSKILWTDESQFTKDGCFNYHNEHRWSRENPRATRIASSQHRFSVNVWAGIVGNQIIGPHFFEGALNANMYLSFLEDNLSDLLEDVPLNIRAGLIFQHDGAPPHYGRQVKSWLNTNFFNRWIGRNGPILWPPRSPDLTPLDFYLWGRVKAIVYSVRITDIDQLRTRIQMAFDQVQEEMQRPGFDLQVQGRARKCVRESGGHFEQLL